MPETRSPRSAPTIKVRSGRILTGGLASGFFSPGEASGVEAGVDDAGFVARRPDCAKVTKATSATMAQATAATRSGEINLERCDNMMLDWMQTKAIELGGNRLVTPMLSTRRIVHPR